MILPSGAYMQAAQTFRKHPLATDQMAEKSILYG